MRSIRTVVRSRKLLFFLAAPPIAAVIAVLALFIVGTLNSPLTSVEAQTDQCEALSNHDERACLIEVLLESGNDALVQEALDNVEEQTTAGLVVLDSQGPDGVVGANVENMLADTQEARMATQLAMQKVSVALNRTAEDGRIGGEQRATAARLSLQMSMLREMVEAVSQVTRNCRQGNELIHPDDPTRLQREDDPVNNCDDLLPLLELDQVRNENPFVTDGQNNLPITRFTRFRLYPSFSVPLRAPIIPPRWTRDPEELVKSTDEISDGSCAVVFKEIRGLQLRLHFDRWVVVRDPWVSVFGQPRRTLFPIWSLEWQPAEYVKTWELCNNGGKIVVGMSQHVKRETPLNYFWRYYSAGTSGKY